MATVSGRVTIVCAGDVEYQDTLVRAAILPHYQIVSEEQNQLTIVVDITAA